MISAPTNHTVELILKLKFSDGHVAYRYRKVMDLPFMPMPGHAFRTDVDESKYSKAIKVDVEPPFNTWRVELESVILDKHPDLQQVSGDVLEYALAARLEHAGWLTMDGDKPTSLWGEETVT